MSEIKLLDVVALLEEMPDEGLKRGEVGIVVEVFCRQTRSAGRVSSRVQRR